MPQHAEHSGARWLIDAAAAVLVQAGVENPHLDAELLLAAATGRSRTEVWSAEVKLDAPARERFAAMVERRRQREPLAYILGRKECFSLDFEVSPAVLIPRPETELVVSEALRILPRDRSATVLDLGTGCGAIALAIAANAPKVEVVATDLSETALEVAQRNVTRLGLRERVTLRRADCFTPLDGGGSLDRFDLIVSNPPYVRDDEVPTLQPEIAAWEPRIALSGGADGLISYRRIAQGLAAHLQGDGGVIVEVGEGQAEAVAALFRASGIGATATIPDLGGITRVVTYQTLRAPSIR